MQKRKLSASLEDYLEAIFHIVLEKQAARVKDIAARMSVTNSSVTGALRELSRQQLVNYAPYDIVTLTPAGQAVAKEIVQRHEALRDFFVQVLAVGEREAEEAACKMEHALPGPILQRLVRFIEFFKSRPPAEAGWVEEFKRYCERNVGRRGTVRERRHATR
ncbi:MAG: metal-dependent transcriptional regulator [Candidatus Abyssobacteria bacterium SURF_17]|jgi:DtxR family Mn-dependent transcriptional regulator|uniref:Transcriptional regulator MntR n=1 Tax=Candidatus Abyssobacteria bacterium SURF_17 TaxID=2093361 RepID=A0A419F9F9_9BACT|nr:MAG: metal-dependent transcriptional regulator [Candidatus Abyssubacteria bacterium SURF_17]